MKAYYRDGKKYVPYNLAWDNMPIDLSFLYSEEKPAGKHGFLKVDGDHFAFEDGTEARFFGVNFNSVWHKPVLIWYVFIKWMPSGRFPICFRVRAADFWRIRGHWTRSLLTVLII